MASLPFPLADLSPGDARAATLDLRALTFDRIASLADPLFEAAYAPLWEQFGATHEIEARAVLGERLAWNPAEIRDGFAFLYALLLVRSADAFAAVRDHTAIADEGGAIVHLSHLLVAPAWRRTGLAGCLRTLPIQTARECLASAGFPTDAPVTLVAEMEYPDGRDQGRDIRLQAYERAGFLKVDPAAVRYRQPDFRPPGAIDASGGPQPLDFQLVIRRVGRETDRQIDGREVRRIVERLYRIYARSFRPQDMEPVWRDLGHYPAEDAPVPLVLPTTPRPVPR